MFVLFVLKTFLTSFDSVTIPDIVYGKSALVVLSRIKSHAETILQLSTAAVSEKSNATSDRVLSVLLLLGYQKQVLK